MLEIQGLDAFYGASHVLQNLSFTVPAAGRVSVLGRNGAGKSTLMKSIMNAGPRVRGRLALDGRDLARIPSFRRARLGLSLVPEDRRIFPHITVVDNMTISAAAAGERVALQPERLLSMFPMLQPLRARYGSQLSGGQQQMLAVARGIAPNPKFLLLDEPTEGLAPVIVDQLATAIVQLCDMLGTGLLLSEQNIWFARRCTSRVHILESGRLVFEGSWPEFDSDPDIKQRYLSV
ncbi:ABC transporter ATP-binding protein [Corticibacterium sp. UT-5YL-CI-8]|nr:ABC transporter ATP-binding protein [Tianweitania sp. UT-5YL-CI-8]